ncbi:hypothetical protein T484DRAFT_2021386 [Baffinella frigidus]|nr:hypothetical protein T484DRAFT_2021386 [Cryptophyta sp. CCMP2293]
MVPSSSLTAWLRPSVAWFVIFGFIITIVVPPAAARRLAPGWCSAEHVADIGGGSKRGSAVLFPPRAATAGLVGAFGHVGSDGAFRLLRLSGGEGGSSRGKMEESEEMPDEDLRVKAALRAPENADVQQTLARNSSGARDAEMQEIREAMDEARASTGEGDVPPSTIAATSPLGIALQDRELTAWFHEAEFRALLPGAPHRYLATHTVLDRVAVFASADGRAFGAHVNPPALHASLFELSVRGRLNHTAGCEGGRDHAAGCGGGVILENMSRAMQRVFRGVDPREVTISLVGGWTKADLHPELRDKYYPHEEAMWRFSAVVRRCVEEALPGAVIDTSLLNRVDGLAREEYTPKNRLRCVRQGQAARVVVLDSHTGRVETQTSDVADLRCVEKYVSPGVMLPESVMVDSLRHDEEMRGRADTFRQSPGRGEVLSPIMIQYRDYS